MWHHPNQPFALWLKMEYSLTGRSEPFYSSAILKLGAVHWKLAQTWWKSYGPQFPHMPPLEDSTTCFVPRIKATKVLPLLLNQTQSQTRKTKRVCSCKKKKKKSNSGPTYFRTENILKACSLTANQICPSIRLSIANFIWESSLQGGCNRKWQTFRKHAMLALMHNYLLSFVEQDSPTHVVTGIETSV